MTPSVECHDRMAVCLMLAHRHFIVSSLLLLAASPSPSARSTSGLSATSTLYCRTTSHPTTYTSSLPSKHGMNRRRVHKSLLPRQAATAASIKHVHGSQPVASLSLEAVSVCFTSFPTQSVRLLCLFIPALNC